MNVIAFQITGVSIVYPTVCLDGADQRKHQSSASLAFVRGIHSSPSDSPYNGLLTRNVFPLDDVIMTKQKYNKAVRILYVMYRVIRWIQHHTTVNNSDCGNLNGIDITYSAQWILLPKTLYRITKFHMKLFEIGTCFHFKIKEHDWKGLHSIFL